MTVQCQIKQLLGHRKSASWLLIVNFNYMTQITTLACIHTTTKPGPYSHFNTLNKHGKPSKNKGMETSGSVSAKWLFRVHCYADNRFRRDRSCLSVGHLSPFLLPRCDRAKSCHRTAHTNYSFFVTRPSWQTIKQYTNYCPLKALCVLHVLALLLASFICSTVSKSRIATQPKFG